MNIAKIERNEEKNGIEIYFFFYPLVGTKATMKKHGFRWNGKKSCWYAKKSDDVEAIASAIADTTEEEYKEIAHATGEDVTAINTTAKKTTKKTASQADAINLDNLGENSPRLYGAELAKAIREDLKRRGVKGVTVRKRDVTYDTGITVTVKATAEDMASVEEYKTRYPFGLFSCNASSYRGIFDGKKWIYSAEWEKMSEEERKTAYDSHCVYYLTKSPDFNNYHHEREDCPSFTTEFYNKVVAIYRIANQWNYNNSDPMTDYFDVGYYLDIDIKLEDGAEPRQTMTDAEREAYAQEIKGKEEAEKKALEKIEEDRRKAEEAEKQREAWEKEARARIAENVEIVDLSEADQVYISGVLGGMGKENSLEELKEDIEEYTLRKEETLISRKAIFTDAQAFEDFSKMFLYDFDFLAGMGGTASEDVRLNDNKTFYNYTQEQRESIKMYNNNCVGVYFDNNLQYIINPEGFSYARYVFILTEDSTTTDAKEELAKQEEESRQKEPFYFPEPVETQAENIHTGDDITVYQCDGWVLNNIYAGFGTVKSVERGTYAQYKGIYITLSQGRKEKKIFIRDGKKTLIYKGIFPPLPESVTQNKISDNMAILYNGDDLIRNTFSYYKNQGVLPIVDTWQR